MSERPDETDATRGHSAHDAPTGDSRGAVDRASAAAEDATHGPRLVRARRARGAHAPAGASTGSGDSDAAPLDPDAIELAARTLADGKLVALPTETVYGLAARADDAAAVASIYAAKGRPAHNPLIVHLADAEAARAIAARWSPTAERLAAALWPGPLTLVVERADARLAPVSAGLPTIALRVPDHPVVHAVLRACRLPLAAPSANRSNSVSPTRAEHVAKSLPHAGLLVLDDGPTRVGIESTVVDVTSEPPHLLRPGGLPIERLLELAPDLVTTPPPTGDAPRSPGQLARHYAPDAKLELLPRSELAAAAADRPTPVGVLTLEPLDLDAAWNRTLGSEPAAYAARLFAALHEADAGGCRSLLVEQPPDDPAWAAVVDRLRRAAR